MSTDSQESAIERSTVYRTLARASRGSVIASRLRNLFNGRSSDMRNRVSEVVAASTVNDVIEHTSDRLNVIAANSALAKTTVEAEDIARSSWLYRWLTAEPEPEVIVIDLRETFSIGPVITVFDRIISALIPAAAQAAVLRSLRLITTTARAAPIRLASFVLLGFVLVETSIRAAIGDISSSGFTLRVAIILLGLGGTQVRIDWDGLTESRVAQLVVALFEPPEAPNERTTGDSASEETDQRE